MWKRLAFWYLKVSGWKIEGEVPAEKRFVLIAAPHTSNWDLPFLLAFAAVFDLKISWLGKHSLFFPPLGMLMRALGGIPIIRHRNLNVVDAMVAEFKTRSELVLVVPTEGTRSRVDYWKSGFYHIAKGADVPIVPSYLDYGNKRGGFGAAIRPSGDMKHDMQLFRDLYADKLGLYPDFFGPVRLREEGAEDEGIE
jgi:1-acyl-sn-glycerol-3-phosphate acyltransferase